MYICCIMEMFHCCSSNLLHYPGFCADGFQRVLPWGRCQDVCKGCFGIFLFPDIHWLSFGIFTFHPLDLLCPVKSKVFPKEIQGCALLPNKVGRNVVNTGRTDPGNRRIRVQPTKWNAHAQSQDDQPFPGNTDTSTPDTDRITSTDQPTGITATSNQG